MDKEELAIEVLKIFSKTDLQAELYWSEDLKPWVICNDQFFWGSGDGEDIEEGDLELLKQSLDDSPYHGVTLFVARKRKTRPQGALYSYIPQEEWHLFNDCGEERDVGMGNPYAPGDYKHPTK